MGDLYRVRTVAGEWRGNGYVWAILESAQPLVVHDGHVEGDLDEDGAKEYFRLCPSSEGVHFRCGQALRWRAVLGGIGKSTRAMASSRSARTRITSGRSRRHFLTI